ncbi:MAG: FKBP-type peptidyl-prolyl cis-trans isomerase [Bacteroidetes bacterium]|nr:FKBP-type peptidyl-prolyl cis-trans isomerase [Bacteroidota bacterium]
MKFTFYFLVSSFLFLFFSCGNPEVKKKKEINPDKFKEQLLKVNKYEVEKESDEINQYIANHNWQMEKTGTGLRYMFLKKGNGLPAQSGNNVKVNYKISLLDGTECYSSEKDGAYEFKVEGEAIESGLQEGVQLMHVGDKAKFIVPSWLAHGLHGDDAKIPPLSSIEADIELLEVK